MFKHFASSMIAGRPFQPFLEADGGQGGTGTDPKDPANPENGDPKDPADPKDPDNGDGKEEPVKFDERQQAEIDKIVARKIAKERAKAEEDRKKAEERAKMSAEEQAEADRKERERIAQEKEQKANDRIVNLEVKDVAREMGVSPKKIERFLKLVDREDIEVDEDGNVDRSKVESAVKAVLSDMPEFKGGSGQQGPGSDFGGGGSAAKYSVAQINAMTPKEVADNYDEVMKSMAIHQKK